MVTMPLPSTCDELAEELASMRGAITRFAQSSQSSYSQLAKQLLTIQSSSLLMPRVAKSLIKLQLHEAGIVQPQIINPDTLLVYPEAANSLIFHPLRSVVVNPLMRTEVCVTTVDNNLTRLSIMLVSKKNIPLSELLWQDFRIFINADSNIAEHWVYVLTEGLQQVSLKINEKVNPLGLSQQVGHCKMTEDRSDNYLLLHDSTDFPEQFNFIDLPQLETFDWPKEVYECELLFEMNTQHLSLPLVEAEHFQLHCVPAINLFKCTSEPIYCDHRSSQYPVMADHNSSAKLQIQSIEHVECENLITGQQQSVKKYLTDDPSQSGPNYSSDLEVNAQNVKARITLAGLPLDDHVVVCDLMVCNGNIPQQLLKGCEQLEVLDHSNLSAKLLTQPSAYRLPPTTLDYTLAALTSTCNPQQIFSDHQHFKKLCHGFNWSQNTLLQQQIDAIDLLECETQFDFTRGVLQQNLVITIHLADSAFRDLPNAYRFGQLLHYLFETHAPMNMGLITHVELIGQPRVWKWNTPKKSSIQ